MSNQITPAQRQQVAQHWRHSPEAQRMAPQQVEQFAQQILSGAADSHVSNYLAQPQLQGQHQQPQQPTTAPRFDFDTFFNGIQMSEIGMPMAPPMQFPPFPQMLQPHQPSNFAPIPTSQIPAMPLVSMPPVGVPHIRQHTTYFPGGHSDHQNVSFSGHSGSAKFSYGSSSTSTSWSSNGGDHPNHVQQQMPALQSHRYPTTIEAAAVPKPGTMHLVPPVPVQQPMQAPQSAPRQPDLQPGYVPPQNPRLGDAFAQLQRNEEQHDTYFSNPPGLPE
ncbi:hypothetical protein LTR08_004125 [Meristemomyces frigidus]|nr:hypothetical protein LTR08_004125 [Meristemomyces frigidus]